MLHVTNGDSAVDALARAGIGPALPWRDVLHEGPVPANLTPRELCAVRARFLAECGWGDESQIASDLAHRDATLLEAPEVTLWFEHDLYDQLQLIQILSMLDGRPADLAQSSDFIGPMSAEQVRRLAAEAQPVTPEQYDTARRAWSAFREPVEDTLLPLLATDLSSLPFLRGGFERLLEERPSQLDGLARSERQILTVVASEPASFIELFKQTQTLEQAAFAGDAQLLLSIRRLAACPVPLITTDPWRLTDAGRQVLDGAARYTKWNPIDRWLGGVRCIAYAAS